MNRFLSPAGRDDRRRAEFEQFVAGSTDSLLRTAYLVVGDLAESEDLVQECFVTVAKRWPRVRTMEHPRAYARRVLLNLALDGSARRSRRRRELEQSETIDDAFDERSSCELTAVDTRSELVAALAGCRLASARCSCCVISRICPSPTRRRRCSARSAPSRAPRRARWRVSKRC